MGSILSSNQFLLLYKLPPKIKFVSKVVKIDSKIIISLPWSNSAKLTVDINGTILRTKLFKVLIHITVNCGNTNITLLDFFESLLAELITVKLGYNEQLGTGHFCSLKPVFVINRDNLCTKMTDST